MEIGMGRYSFLSSFIIFLALFSGCGSSSKKSGVSTQSQKQGIQEGMETNDRQVLLSVEGKPAITVTQFEDHLQKIITSNPQIAQVIDSVPSVKYKIFSGMVGQELLNLWVEKSGVGKSDRYKRDLRVMISLVESELARKYFQEDIEANIKVTASEVKKYYEENKNSIPDLVLSPGGVNAIGVAFDSEEKANSFVKQDHLTNSFKETAQKEGLQVVDFGLVNNYSVDLDKPLREKLGAVSAAPRVVKAKTDDGKYWVCLATGIEKVEYRPLTEVSNGIEQMLKSEKVQLAFGQKIEALKTVYRAQERVEYFEQHIPQELLAEQECEEADAPTRKVSSRVA